jgi:predicted transcriptional regulator
LPNPVDPALQAIRGNIDEINRQIRTLESQRDRLIRARDLLAPEPRTQAANAKRGRPPGTKGATIRQELHKRLAIQRGPETQANLVRGMDSGYCSKVLQEMEAAGLIRRHKEKRGEGVDARYVNVVTPVDFERLAAGPQTIAAASPRPRATAYGWTPDREKTDAVLAFMQENDEELSVQEIANGVGLSTTTISKCLDILRGEHRIRLAGKRPDRGRATVYRVMPSAEGIPSADVPDPMAAAATATPNDGVTNNGSAG